MFNRVAAFFFCGVHLELWRVTASITPPPKKKQIKFQKTPVNVNVLQSVAYQVLLTVLQSYSTELFFIHTI